MQLKHELIFENWSHLDLAGASGTVGKISDCGSVGAGFKSEANFSNFYFLLTNPELTFWRGGGSQPTRKIVPTQEKGLYLGLIQDLFNNLLQIEYGLRPRDHVALCRPTILKHIGLF